MAFSIAWTSPRRLGAAPIGISRNGMGAIKETLDKSFNWPSTNGKGLISFVVSPSTSLRRALSNHTARKLVQRFLRSQVVIKAILVDRDAHRF